ncbi:SMI1/KNR4 family protein [Hamadaea sp. NPDC051192]|uniref:SMI1/KNR4 family protein n=1 Tax=Hamadaea sp. NPDC051192 TaxID=3154940 RepID=UPI0034370828
MTHPDAGQIVTEAWARIEAALARVLPETVPTLRPPATEAEIDAVEAALGLPLPPDFQASLRVHDGTEWAKPSAVPLDLLYPAAEIVEATRMWRDGSDDDPLWTDPGVLAYQIDDKTIRVSGAVRPTLTGENRVPVGTMNGDVWWLLDLDPPQGGTPGQVFRVDPECTTWDVLAPSWTELLLRYADDLERYAADPSTSTLDIDAYAGPACEWGEQPDAVGIRPEWLRDVAARDPYDD